MKIELTHILLFFLNFFTGAIWWRLGAIDSFAQETRKKVDRHVENHSIHTSPVHAA